MDWELSPNQQLFAEFLLQRIGFSISSFTQKYLQSFYRFSHFDKFTDEAIYLNIAIEALQQEIDTRKRLHAYLKRIYTKNISASEIENFTFCPAAFSITATFTIPRNTSTIIGSDFHEKELLNPRFKKLGPAYGLTSHFAISDSEMNKTDLETYFEGRDSGLLEDLRCSELLYSDASRSTDEPFASKNGTFIGRPDYIFRNKTTGRIYIVEEKFSLMTARRTYDTIRFYKNHTNQVRSYVYGISNFDISYGYLVYWRYRYSNQLPLISYAACKKIEKTMEARQELIEVYQSIRSVIRKGIGEFKDKDRDPRKCANCGASIFCGHKTGKYDTFQFPYALQHASLQKAVFPELLVKRCKKETICFNGETLALKERIFKQFCYKYVSALNVAHPPLDFSQYKAEWLVENGKLYLQQFTFLSKKVIEGRREVLWEYTGSNDQAHFMQFISATITCYRKKYFDEKDSEEFEELVLKITRGLVEMTRTDTTT